MTRGRTMGGIGLLVLGAFFYLASIVFTEVRADAPLKFKAQLIWGTDTDRPKDTEDKIKELNPKFKEKLARLFKWKNYFEVDREIITVPNKGSKITCMSHDCVVEVFHRGDSNIEVHLYGEGKLFQKIRQDLVKGQYLTIGGNVKKKDEAWIVALSVVE